MAVAPGRGRAVGGLRPKVAQELAKQKSMARAGVNPGPCRLCVYLEAVLPGLVTAGDEWASPITAQALPAWVIGPRFLGGAPPGRSAREAIAHDPSGRWVFARNACALLTASSAGFTPASARAYSACPVA